MASTDKTPFAELPQFQPSDKPTWLGDFNNSMMKIDGKLSEANTKNTQQDLQINQALNTSAEAVDKAEEAQKNAQAAVDAANAVKNRIPVNTGDIEDGAVTASKLDATAMNAILKGITIRAFNSDSAVADNDGLIAPPEGRIKGFYVPDIGLLVIEKFEGKGICEYTGGQTTARLPNYVQRPQKNYTIGNAVRYADGQDFKTWTGFGMNSAGGVGLNTSSTNDSFTLFGTYAVLMGATQGRVLTGDYAGTFLEENGLI